jgi:two-component system, chemotaxis family, chemotaxis protein CheY
MNSYLLIDDEEVFNFIHTQVINLADPDAAISEIRSSTEAIRFLRENAANTETLPDIIFLDINMPEINGFELLEELAPFEAQLTKKPHIYMVTSSLFESDRKRAASFPMLTGFMEKPISAADITAVADRRRNNA